ncbi:hypothetical protein [Saccharopolyspora sp. ASAGF58]|uniref:hypothetical protein n=1 Tax=Saccharopolyspora sp. ASAGF58 TaxID=2719023 RepID=UPI001FF0CE50|nr:hypothetical protein [Saccharopolyspora sp. ASAGF58]
MESPGFSRGKDVNCVYLFVVFGAGLGLIMQVVVLVVQNAVPAAMIGTATSTNNYFREVGAALGTAVFGTIFTTRLTENLTGVFTASGASASDASTATATLDPQKLSQLPAPVRDGVVTAYADALAPVFWYLLPFIGIAFVLALVLKQIPLSDVAGLVARGEAIGGEEAERLEAELRKAPAAGSAGGAANPRTREPANHQGLLTVPEPVSMGDRAWCGVLLADRAKAKPGQRFSCGGR